MIFFLGERGLNNLEFGREISMAWPRIGRSINGTRVFPNNLFLGRAHWPLKPRSIFHDFGAAKSWWILVSMSVSHIKWCHRFWTCSTKIWFPKTKIIPSSHLNPPSIMVRTSSTSISIVFHFFNHCHAVYLAAFNSNNRRLLATLWPHTDCCGM